MQKKKKKKLSRKDILCSWIRISNITKIAVWPKLIYRFDIISIKNSRWCLGFCLFFKEIDMLILNSCRYAREPE